MTINGIIWLENIVEKLLIKHNVTPEEIIEVLNNNPKFKFVEKGFRENEDVYAALGQTLSGRYLIIFFVYKKSKEIIIISARDMTKKEKNIMKKNKSSISKASTYEEMGDFWGTHDLTDFMDKIKDVDIKVNLKNEKIFFSLDKTIAKNLRKIAKQRGISPETFLNQIVYEKLNSILSEDSLNGKGN